MAAAWRGRPLPRGEAARKLVHAGMGLFALALPFLTVWQAAGCAGLAFLHNWLVLPRVLGHRLASARSGGSDRGVLLYPLVVLGLVLVFRDRLELAALGWGVLAFGDAAAGVAGQKWGRRGLPWNPGKTWEGFAAFILAGGVGGGALAFFYQVMEGGMDVPGVAETPLLLGGYALALAVPLLLAGVFESLPHGLDDNLLPPFVVPALVAFAWFGEEALAPALLLPLAVNTGCALLAAVTRTLRPGGIAVAWLLGVATWVVGGWRTFVVLLAFLLGGLAVTFLGYGRKRARGTAEGHGGRRGALEVLGKGAVALAIALEGVAAAPFDAALPGWVLVAVLAAATADTWATEVGGLLGRRPFTLMPLQPATPGTPGAVSWPGLGGAVAGAALITGLAAGLGLLGADPWPAAAAVVTAAMAAGVAESLLPALGPATHAGKNLVVTFLAPLLTYVLLGVLP